MRNVSAQFFLLVRLYGDFLASETMPRESHFAKRPCSEYFSKTVEITGREAVELQDSRGRG